TRHGPARGEAEQGRTMSGGGRGALERLKANAHDDIAGVSKPAAMGPIGKGGGAAGPLYGTMFLEMGKVVDGKERLEAEDLAAAFRAGIDGIKARGKAEEGDKTMIDALEPAYAALQEAVASGRGVGEAIDAAAEAAARGLE